MTTELRKLMLESLNGCEVRTCLYETWNGVVFIDGEKVVADGKVIDENISDEKLAGLWHDYLEEEGILAEMRGSNEFYS